MTVPILFEENITDGAVLTGDAGLVQAAILVSSKSYPTVRKALEDTETKSHIMDTWKNLISCIQSGRYTGTDEAGQDIVSALMEYPKVILEHEDFKDLKINPYFKEVQAIKLPFPKMVVMLGGPFDVEAIIKKSGIDKSKHDLGEGNINMFWSLYAVQHDEQVMVFVPLMDTKTMGLHILEIGMVYGETPTGSPKILTWVHPNQQTWITQDQLSYYLRLVSEAIFMMTLNPNTTQAYVSIPTDKDVSVNKKRIRNNKKPLIEFKLITIDGKKRDPIPVVPHGTHAPPRQHWRRGHWRHYSSGKTVFIEPMLVGDEKNGKIIKDYAIGTYEDRGHERGRANYH